MWLLIFYGKIEFILWQRKSSGKLFPELLNINFLFCEVIKVTLNIYNGCTLIAATACKVTK